jgi:hypothetical protein
MRWLTDVSWIAVFAVCLVFGAMAAAANGVDDQIVLTMVGAAIVLAILSLRDE